MRENELELTDEDIARLAAKFCYSARSKREESAVIWLIEHLVLPADVPNGYTEHGMEVQIMRAIKEKECINGKSVLFKDDN